MDEHLRPAFAWLRRLGASICHYKVCSTFDSSPTIGNIGRAVELGREAFGGAGVPMVVGAPQLRRYTAFGHLFAGYQDRVYRIDRHPVMSRHPVTPMHEADLLVHLSHQTRLTTGLLDLATLQSARRAEALDALLGGGADIVLIDVDNVETQRLAGSELWRSRREGGAFVVGSSGVEYALMAEWAALGIAPGSASIEPVPAVDRIAVVSGSCSPMTERQIRHALGDGFDGIEVDPVALASGSGDAAIAAAVAAGSASLSAGRSAILYTALGPTADRGAEIDREEGARHRLGRGLGEILRRLTEAQSLRRVVIAGGDTSSHALGMLGVDALTMRMPLTVSPGSPLCLAHSTDAATDGLEIALKGGQIGRDAYFSTIRDGKTD